MEDNKLAHFSLREYLWKRKFGYISNPQVIDIGWTIVNVYGTITIPLDMLLAAISTKNGNIRVPIEQTPHYCWIKSLVDGEDDPVSREKYLEYNRLFQAKDVFMPNDMEKRLDHMKAQVSLYRSDIEKIKSIAIITSAPKRKFRMLPYAAKIYDGVHRACIMRAFGYKSIQCLVK
jgi:hypothetical protein